MPPLKWRKQLWIHFSIWGIMMVFCAFFTGIVQIIIAVVAIVYLCIIVALSFIFWRCPNCTFGLPLQGMIFMEYCPYCGKPLDTDEDKNDK